MIAFLCNGEKWKYIGKLRKIALTFGFHYYITDSVAQISEVLAEMAENQIQIICVLGGDGTICQLVSAVFRRRERLKQSSLPPKIAVLGGGTMNNLFSVLKLRGPPDHLAKKIVEEATNSQLKVIKLPLLRVTHNGQVYFGFTFILGPIVRLLKQYTDNQRNFSRAMMTAVLACSAATVKWPKNFTSLIKPFEAQILVNDRRIQFNNLSGILASTVRRTAFGFYPFLGNEFLVSPKFDRFYTIICGLSPNEIVAKIFYLGYLHFWDIFFPSSGLRARNQYFNQPVNNLRIRNPSEDIFTIDGEIFPIQKGKEITVSFGPEISLVCPSY
ncbi:MAG: acylglycerol kinase family protein [Patescibacteria group bacterium]